MKQPFKIIYTKTDEAPALATYSLLPLVQSFTSSAGIEMELKDISLAGRIIAQFPERLKEHQRQPDALAELGSISKTPHANIIKLPNISASIPQLKAAINELQEKGYNLPDYPENPKSNEEEEIRNTYSKVLGSAVNPVLREGNSDRRVAIPVKEYAKKNPHSMGEWNSQSKTHVAHMENGDFYSSEQSVVINEATDVRIELVKKNGETQILKERISLLKDEVIDSSVMSIRSLRKFYEEQVQDAKKSDLLFSLHLKATMMKISDPILFGEAVKIFFEPVFDKHTETFNQLGVDTRNGLTDVLSKIKALPENHRSEIEQDIQNCYQTQARLAMVDSDNGITNLHVPSDVIIDASMPAAIRVGGKMWGADGKLHDIKAIIPDRCYARIYQETIDFCKKHGAFDPRTMGNVANVGLMAKKAEEYGSHDKTYWIPSAGTIKVVTLNGQTLMEHSVEEGDIWRMCQTKDISIRDWVKLCVTRARLTGSPAVFWLDKSRAHDANLIKKVNTYIKDHDTKGLEIEIMSPQEAIRFTLERVKNGSDTISVTGNVLRDYLTDLFPILELGTSAKMLSIVPLLAGGGLFETGAGGSAPKHVQQFLKENHLRWDSLGEFLALGVSLEDLGIKNDNQKALTLSTTLNEAIGTFLNEDKSPSRNVNELDNRGSHFYLALYWAEALSHQTKDLELQNRFAPLAQKLRQHEKTIVNELNQAQGQPIDVDGYYKPDDSKVIYAMKPSSTLNQIFEQFNA